MTFTANCDLFGAVHERGVNRVVRHIMRQRPSLFNYATADVAANPELWCAQIPVTSDVTNRHNPLFTIMNPLPVFGADAPPVGIGFCAQLVEAELDFHKQNVIPLPAELNPPLKEQRFSFHFRVCGAIDCPSPKLIDRIPIVTDRRQKRRDKGRVVVFPGTTDCFCLDVFAVGHFRRQQVGAQHRLVGEVDSMDIVDIKPDALEDNLICYLKTTVNVILREKLTIALESLMLSFPLFGLATVTLTPTPDPPIPNNPAVEDDELKAFVTMTVI
jgi:hypothetical protein